MYIIPLIYHLKFLIDLKKYYFKNIKGYDERQIIYPYLVQDNNVSYYKILQINKNKTLIDLLESKHTTIHDKLEIIGEKKNPEIFNLFAGGLFNDWNFE
jgi:hypothetical protein